MDLSGPGIDVKLKEKEKKSHNTFWIYTSYGKKIL
jgi:hypothetical protein